MANLVGEDDDEVSVRHADDAIRCNVHVAHDRSTRRRMQSTLNRMGNHTGCDDGPVAEEDGKVNGLRSGVERRHVDATARPTDAARGQREHVRIRRTTPNNR
jgi:hypothetical protein